MSHRARGQWSIRVFLPALVLLSAGRAAAVTVILVPPAGSSAAMTEALVRVRGELVSEGYTVEVAMPPTEPHAPGVTSPPAPRGNADAVVAMVGDQVPDAVEIRVLNPLTGKFVLRRMSFQPSSDVTAKTLAIHTLELIRATFLELDLSPAPPRPAARSPQPELLSPSPSVPPARGPERVGVDVGATIVFGLDDLDPVLLPLVRINWALRPWLLPHLTVAGLGTRRAITSDGARADVSEQFALVGASYRFRAALRLRPFASLSAGVLHTSAEGQANSPDFGRDTDRWSFVVDGTVGAWLALGNRFQLAVALQAQVAEPYPAVRFFGSGATTSTRPSLLLTVTLGTWL